MGDIGVGLRNSRSSIKDSLDVPEGAYRGASARDRRTFNTNALFLSAILSSNGTINDALSNTKEEARLIRQEAGALGFISYLSAKTDKTLEKEWKKPYGTRRTEFRAVDSSYGKPIQQASSNIRVAGNVIWMNEVRESILTKSIPDTETNKHDVIPGSFYFNEYHYFSSFAISFIDTLNDLSGEIVRLWADGQIIWDIRDINVSYPAQLVDVQTRKYKEYSHYRDTVIRVYNGTTDNVVQDSTMIEALGEGNVPLYYGMCYAVFTNLDLNLFGGSMPNIQAEISYNGTRVALGRGLDYTGTFQTDQVAWQHYTADEHKIGTSAQYWQNLDIYTAVATQGPETWHYDPMGNDEFANFLSDADGSGKLAGPASTYPNFRVDRWGNCYAKAGSWQPFYYGNSSGHAIFHRKSGTADVTRRVFDDTFWFPPEHTNYLGDPITSLEAAAYYGETFDGTHRNPAPISFHYLPNATNDTVLLYTQSHIAAPGLPSASAYLSVMAGTPLQQNNGKVISNTGSTNFTSFQFMTFDINYEFGIAGDSTYCLVPDLDALFMMANRLNTLETQIYYKGIGGFVDKIAPVENVYPKWNAYTDDVLSSITLSTAGTPEGCVFSDLGSTGKVLTIGGDNTFYRYDVNTLDNDDTLFSDPIVNVLTLAEKIDSTTGNFTVSDFNWSQGLQGNRLCGIVPHTAGQVIDTAWGFYDVSSMSRAGPTYNQSEAIQMVGELEMSPTSLIGGMDYFPSVHGVMAYPFFGTGNPSMYIFRVKPDIATLDVVVTRLILPFIPHISADDIDVTDLASTPVIGYVVADAQDLTEYIKRLQDIYLFDAVEIDAKLVFKLRGQGDTPIDIEERLLDFKEQYHHDNIIERTRIASLLYADFELDYQQSSQLAKNLDSLSMGEAVLTTPVVFDKDEAAQRIDIALKVNNAEYKTIAIDVSREYSYLSPGDIVAFKEFGRIRITSSTLNTNGSVHLEGVNEALSAYTSSAVGSIVENFKSVYLSTSRIIVISIEVPYLTTNVSTVGRTYIAAYQRFSPASVKIYAHTDNINFTFMGVMPQSTFICKFLKCTHLNMDETTSYLQPSRYTEREGTFDYTQEIEVCLVYGDEPISRTEAEVFRGKNVVAIGNELVGFLNVSKVAENRYKLSGLLRGMFSTHNKMDTHIAGEHVVEFLNLPKINYLESDIDKGVGVFGYSAGRYSIDPVDSINTGVSFTPLEVANIEFSKAVNDIVITWDRKNRYNGRMESGTDIAAGDTTYKVEISDYRDNTVIRTFDLLALETMTYTSAEQITDYGVNQTNISVVIYQVNDAMGDGRSAIASSTFSDVEYIRDFSSETVGAAANFIGFNDGFASANVVSTREDNVLEIECTDVGSPYYYILDDMYNVVNKTVEIVFRYDTFASASGSILRVAFEGVDNSIINYVEVTTSAINYALYINQDNIGDAATRSVTIPTLSKNTWYKLSCSLINNVFNVYEIVEPHFKGIPKLLANETPGYAKLALDDGTTLGGGIGLGNKNRNIKTQVKYIKVT